MATARKNFATHKRPSNIVPWETAQKMLEIEKKKSIPAHEGKPDKFFNKVNTLNPLVYSTAQPIIRYNFHFKGRVQ